MSGKHLSAVVSDIHIRLRNRPDFESGRVLQLAEHLASKDYHTIVLNGDLLDSSRPTLDEIHLAQAFIDTLAASSRVILLDGNHESVNVSKKLSTYDKVRMHNCEYVKDRVLQMGETTVRCASWSHLKSLTFIEEADILITHIRCSLPPFIEEERSTDFLDDYQLCILGDIHHKHSVNDHTHYTSSPYNVKFSSSEEKGSYIEFAIDGSNFWQYVDLELPQKLKITGLASDLIDFKPNPRHLYKVFVEGSIPELKALKPYKNVEYVKVVHGVEVESDTPPPETIDLIDLLTTEVCKMNGYDDPQPVHKLLEELE